MKQEKSNKNDENNDDALAPATYERECRILIGHIFRKREAMIAVLEYIRSVKNDNSVELEHIETILSKAIRTDEQLDEIEMMWLNRHRNNSELLLRHNPSLTKEELAVCLCIVDNLTNDQISAQLFRGVKTIDFYRQSIRKKLGITGGKNALLKYLQNILGEK